MVSIRPKTTYNLLVDRASSSVQTFFLKVEPYQSKNIGEKLVIGLKNYFKLSHNELAVNYTYALPQLLVDAAVAPSLSKYKSLLLTLLYFSINSSTFSCFRVACFYFINDHLNLY